MVCGRIRYRRQNGLAASRRFEPGGATAPPGCVQGFVWLWSAGQCWASLSDQIRSIHTVRTVHLPPMRTWFSPHGTGDQCRREAICHPPSTLMWYRGRSSPTLPRQLIWAGPRADSRYFRNRMQPHFLGDPRHCRRQLRRPLAPQLQLHWRHSPRYLSPVTGW